MRVSIIADDQLVIIDGRAHKSHAPLPIDPSIHAVQYDTDKGWGEIEFRPIDPDGPEGPELPYKPENKKIVEADFADQFRALVQSVLESQAMKPAPASVEKYSPNPVPMESHVSEDVLARLIQLENHLAGILPRIVERLDALEMSMVAVGEAATRKLEQGEGVE